MMERLLKLLKQVIAMVSRSFVKLDDWVTAQLISWPEVKDGDRELHPLPEKKETASQCEEPPVVEKSVESETQPAATAEPEPPTDNGQEVEGTEPETEHPMPETEPAATDESLVPLLDGGVPGSTAVEDELLDAEEHCNELTHTGPLATMCLLQPADEPLPAEVQPEPVKRKRKVKAPSETTEIKPKRTRKSKAKPESTDNGQEAESKPKRKSRKKTEE